ncbi:MAG: sugar transferase [Polyangiaceae bacterium]|nr:sugar transferase [Polyangiaceae bacterium]
MGRPSFYQKVGKRALDIAVSGTALVAFAPVLAGVAVLVKTKLGSPVVFKQPRAGKNHKPFTIYKFRTMTDERGPDGKLLPDNDRLTPFGKFLRATSLDELPELFNILNGDMSLVGPRPLLVKYVPLYSPEQARRHEVRPGLTGWAAVNGRNSTQWSERLAADVWYVDNLSFALDLKILWRTVSVVLKRENIDHGNVGIMPEFTGN